MRQGVTGAGPHAEILLLFRQNGCKDSFPCTQRTTEPVLRVSMYYSVSLATYRNKKPRPFLLSPRFAAGSMRQMKMSGNLCSNKDQVLHVDRVSAVTLSCSLQLLCSTLFFFFFPSSFSSCSLTEAGGSKLRERTFPRRELDSPRPRAK